MGGPGSGTWYRYAKKDSVESAIRLDIRYLKKRGMLHGGNHLLSWSWGGEVSSRAVIRVRAGESITVLCKWYDNSVGMMETLNKTINLARTACPLGGTRQWLVCPHCSRRMAVLILAAPTLACRHCLDLSYSSQSEDMAYRALRRRNKIADRLGFKDELESFMGKRPKGMHRTTFNRLVREMEDADNLALFSMCARLKC